MSLHPLTQLVAVPQGLPVFSPSSLPEFINKTPNFTLLPSLTLHMGQKGSAKYDTCGPLWSNRPLNFGLSQALWTALTLQWVGFVVGLF